MGSRRLLGLRERGRRIKPLGRRVIIRRAVNSEQKRGLIWIPDRAKSVPQEGTVVAVGDQVETIKLGERVLFGRHAGSPVDIDGEPYLVLWMTDVMAVLE